MEVRQSCLYPAAWASVGRSRLLPSNRQLGHTPESLLEDLAVRGRSLASSFHRPVLPICRSVPKFQLVTCGGTGA
jgi:hypothetical protein